MAGITRSGNILRWRVRLGIEARVALTTAAALLAGWTIAWSVARSPAVAWAGVGALLAYLLTVTLLHVMVVRPLRRSLRGARTDVQSGADNASAVEHPGGAALALLESLVGSDRYRNQTTVANDVLRLRANNRQLIEVADIGRELNAALPYRETVERALARSKRFLRADFVALLSRIEDNSFRVEGSLGVRSRSLDADCCGARDDCPLRAALVSGRLVRSHGHTCDLFPRTMTEQLSLPLPLPEGGSMVLLATSTTRTHLDSVSDEALETLGRDVANALATARKFDSIRRQVVTDHLTRLYNRRHFIHRAQEEVARSLREQAPMSVVLVDIDHFKRINDTYGHATGDRVLQAVAAHLQDAVRSSDVCARYGGEEFTLLLPNTPGENAVFMAERVRRSLASTRYTGLGLPGDVSVTISCGVATCPRDATTVEELLELADSALYQAKADGRDCVRLYEPQSQS